jgi:hypothetical protein
MLQWPKLSSNDFFKRLHRHNEMIKLRVNIRNKLIVNKFSHVDIYFKDLADEFTEEDLEIFFNVQRIISN